MQEGGWSTVRRAGLLATPPGSALSTGTTLSRWHWVGDGVQGPHTLPPHALCHVPARLNKHAALPPPPPRRPPASLQGTAPESLRFASNSRTVMADSEMSSGRSPSTSTSWRSWPAASAAVSTSAGWKSRCSVKRYRARRSSRLRGSAAASRQAGGRAGVGGQS